jgi:hypothetical protein
MAAEEIFASDKALTGLDDSTVDDTRIQPVGSGSEKKRGKHYRSSAGSASRQGYFWWALSDSNRGQADYESKWSFVSGVSTRSYMPFFVETEVDKWLTSR